ncbi:MAG: ABC transporter ATP-binding protein [Anaerolineae bacterium]|nr:ABC transporter ATP-binding protein [Anaerolineae bacterium]
MNNVSIRAQKLAKLYRIGQRESYRLLRDVLADAMASPFRAAASVFDDRQGNELRSTDDHVWALKGVSFEVKQGQVVGIIGPNGAGKTTLLKILSRITEPTEGQVEIRGRVGSLLEVGTGFHPELTGRENIYLNGAILGMKKAEIERKFDEIVEFSGVERFIDTPVKRYSSGMYVRLAFAVAAHLEPEILLVDEVLAVGDLAFQRKCLGKMEEVSHEGRTVIFVSHNLNAIWSLCPQTLWLDTGQIVDFGESGRVITRYRQHMSRLSGVIPEQDILKRSNDPLRITNFRLEDLEGNPCASVPSGGAVRMVLDYVSDPAVAGKRDVYIGIGVSNEMGQRLFSLSNRFTDQQLSEMASQGQFVCTVPCLPLVPGQYDIKLACQIQGGESVQKVHLVGALMVREGDFFASGRIPDSSFGHVLVPHSWSQRSEASWNLEGDRDAETSDH